MAFIDFVEWRPESNDIYAWRFPEDNLSTATQLIVRESQEAVLFSKGRIIGKFGAGKHTLSSENLPLLREIFGLPFGGKNPFTCEVWFVNKAAPLTIEWKADSARVLDADYNVMVPLVSRGRYGLKVTDAERFLIKLVGSVSSFNTAALTDHFMGPLLTKTKSAITSYMTTNRIGVMQISAHLDELSAFIGTHLKNFWADYGLGLTGFFVTSVDLDSSTPEGAKIAQAMSDKSAQQIAGYTWQQKEAFSVANGALGAGGQAGGMGILGAALMTGMIGGGGGMGQSVMTPPTQAPLNNGFAPSGGFQGAQRPGMANIKEVFCSNCGQKYPVTSKFCPNCGDPYLPCPMCGADNAQGSKRCVRCGASLESSAIGGAGLFCPRCKAPLEMGVKFCPSCGAKV